MVNARLGKLCRMAIAVGDGESSAVRSLDDAGGVGKRAAAAANQPQTHMRSLPVALQSPEASCAWERT